MNDVVPKPISAHFVVTRDGKVYQFVDLKDAARTNATSANPNDDNYYQFARHDFFRNQPMNANDFCVAIECAEFGHHGAIQTDAQYWGILRTLALIHQKTEIPIDSYHVIGHGDIAPLSKWFCPGANFPLQDLIGDFNSCHAPIAVPLPPEKLLV